MSDARALPRRVLHELYTYGNRDLLFGSLLHWLLDANAEHGIGTGMIHRLAAFLEEHEFSELAFALQSDMLPVTSDLIQRGETADLLVSLADSPRLALVSLYTMVQEPHVLAEYQVMEATPVGITHPGCPVNDALSVPVWSWVSDLSSLLPQLPAGPFGDFARQLVAYNPDDPSAASSLVDLDLGAAAMVAPGGVSPPPAPAPRPAAPPPAPAWEPPQPGPAPGGGLSDGWQDGATDAGGGWGSGGGGGGLSDGWMGG